MRIFSIVVYNCASKPVIISSAADLSAFGLLKKGTAKEILNFVSREVVERTEPGSRHVVSHTPPEPVDGVNTFLCNSYVTKEKIGCAVVTDGDYDSRVAFGLMTKAIEETVRACPNAQSATSDLNARVPELNNLLVRYQKPEEVDQIMRINRDIEETKQIMVENIDKMLARGEKIETLMDKSQDLSFHSKAFMKKSKELNRCCTII